MGWAHKSIFNSLGVTYASSTVYELMAAVPAKPRIIPGSVANLE